MPSLKTQQVIDELREWAKSPTHGAGSYYDGYDAAKFTVRDMLDQLDTLTPNP